MTATPKQAEQIPALKGDLAFAASNPLGIPDLDPALCALGVPLPVLGWGQTSREKQHGGTWHFYTDDYRFARLERVPQRLHETGCVAATEINYSIYDDTPLAVAYWTIYKKRYLARFWQLQGIRIFVDCNLPERVLDRPESKYGIPARWVRVRDAWL